MPAHRSTLAVLLLFGIASAPASAQTFTRITTGNPIVTSPVPRTSLYTGCAWVDFDDDGDQDFYIVQQGLFRNDGGGNFTRLTVIPPDHANAIGCSWADADNDGDPDLFVSGGPPGGSVLYVNQGNGTFARATNGAIGASALNQGWGCAWADWDLDGRVDLAISAAFGYLGITTSNHLLRNLGALDFESVDTSAVSARTAPYTIPTWNDVDLDGDPDLFIASGPADGSVAPDYLYENRRAATGQTFFRRFTAGPLATDAHDAQVYAWVDVDSDGDLDVYVTNYGGPSADLGLPNDLYRNDGGQFVRLTPAEAGSIVSDANHSLASVWADFDNDGDLDCVVTNDGAEPQRFYTNDGSGFFTAVTGTALDGTGPRFGAAAADYDLDGDVDLYVHGTTTTRGLFRNDLRPGSPNGWLDVHCVGSISNRSAIGARVYVRCTIGGVSRNLVQQVSAQNSFAGHNAFDPHFGLGDAVVVESLVVVFPSGIRQAMAGVAINQRLTVLEDATTAVTISLVSAEAFSDHVRVVWQLGESTSPFADVERREEGGEWTPIGRAFLDADARVSFEDLGIRGGASYEYQLVVLDEGVVRRIGQARVTVPAVSGAGFEWLGPNPVRSEMRLALGLSAGVTARVRMIDSAGRVVRVRDVSGHPSGRTEVDLGSGRSLPAGIYWVTATAPGFARRMRIAVVH